MSRRRIKLSRPITVGGRPRTHLTIRWPDRTDAELQAMIARQANASDVLAVSTLLSELTGLSRDEALQIPSDDWPTIFDLAREIAT